MPGWLHKTGMPHVSNLSPRFSSSNDNKVDLFWKQSLQSAIFSGCSTCPERADLFVGTSIASCRYQMHVQSMFAIVYVHNLEDLCIAKEK